MAEQRERTEALGENLKIYVGGAHVFTSDALLLADFAHPKKKDIACDLGTGNGIIPLLWVRDFSPIENIGVEISPQAVRLFEKSLKENHLEGTVRCVHADMRDLSGVLPFEYFDGVSINPPYKRKGAGLTAAENDNQNARHEYTCTLYDAANAASKLLRFGGRFVLCQRPERLCDALCVLRDRGLEPKILREVVQRRGAEPSLILLEGKKGAAPGMRVRPVLYIEDETGGYTKEVDRIFNAYKVK